MPTAPRFADRIKRLTGSVARDILSRTKSSDLVSFAGGLPDPSSWAGFTIPEIDLSILQYGPSEGDIALRTFFAEGLATIGVKASPEHLVITSGSQQGLDLAAKLFVEPGTPIVLEGPTYLAALQVFQLFGAQMLTVQIDENGLCPTKLEELLRERKPAAVYLNPTFQNPSGYCYPEANRQALAEVLDRYDTTLIEDDPYRDVYFGEEPPRPICSRLRNAPWIYLRSVSKTLMPGLRMGYLACSDGMQVKLVQLKQAADLHTNRMAQSIVYQSLRDRERFAAKLRGTIAHYQAKREVMQAALQETFADLATWQLPQGGMFFWLKLKKKANLRAALELTLAQNVAFMPGDPFFSERSHDGDWVRINFSYPKPEQILSGLKVVAAALRETTL